ncbi:Guanosine-5'-triphosphate,3'-diphosphate pyrophosphatase [bacterium HR15]|nr:Guanosine-5'-triphosphate,3'-diphosphate pyrophosphatase [bacterium HR15]
MKAAVLDIGSNSVLLLVAERTADSWRILTDQAAITRLGEGFDPDRKLKPKAVQRTLRVIEEYLLQVRQMGVDKFAAVATAVVRRATNPEALLQPLQAMGCPVRVLSEREEAELSFLAVALDPAMLAPPPNDAHTLEEEEEIAHSTHEPQPQTNGEIYLGRLLEKECVPFSRTRHSTNGGHTSELIGEAPSAWLVIDIGGGSVEFAYGPPSRDTARLRWRSLPVGAMSLREQLAPSNPPDADEIGAVSQWLDRQFRFLSLLPPPEQVVTVGGTGVNLALLWRGLHAPEALSLERVHGSRLTQLMLHKMLRLLLSLSDSERARLPGVEPARAPILHLGALILARALSAVNQSSVRISTYGLRYGVLWSMAPESLGRSEPFDPSE